MDQNGGSSLSEEKPLNDHINVQQRHEQEHNDSSNAPTDAEQDSSEAETVILPKDERRPPPGAHRKLKLNNRQRLFRRISADDDDSNDNNDNNDSSDDDNDSSDNDDTHTNTTNAIIQRRKKEQKKRKQKQKIGSQGSGNNHHKVESRSASPNIAGANHSHSSTTIQPVRKDGSPIRDASGRLLLQKYCDKGDYERAKTLLHVGVDVNDRDYAGNTAIHDAALKGHTSIVELLLDHGAIIDIRSGVDDLDTPLIDAASRANIDTVKLLLERGADPRIYNAQGKTALDSVPADDPSTEELEKMLKEAAYKFRTKARRDSGSGDNNNGEIGEIDNATNFDPSKYKPGTFPDTMNNQKDESGNETSTTARKRGGARAQSIRNDLLWMDLTTRTGRDMVYRKAADGDIQYVGRSLEEGWQPDGDCLVLAAKHGHTELVSLLLAFGGQSDALNEDGQTALEQTIGRGHLGVVELLLNAGADPLRKDRKGRSYYDIARDAVGSDDEETVMIHHAMNKARSDEKKPSHSDKSDSDATRKLKKRKLLKREDSVVKREPKKLKSDKEKDNKVHQHQQLTDEQRRRLKVEEMDKRKQQKLEEREREKLRERKEKEKREREAKEKQEKERLAELERQKELEAEKELQREKERQRQKELEAEREAKLAAERAREEERKRREALEQQKEKDRKEREKKMLQTLEAEEKRREEKRKREEQMANERQEKERLERERQKQLEHHQELERQRLIKEQREADARKHLPYGIRTAHYGVEQTYQMMRTKLPLLSLSKSDGELFLDLQIMLLLGLPSIYSAYPDLTKKLVTDQEKSRIWSLITPWICRPLDPFSSSPSVDEIIHERQEEKKRFNAMTFFWLKVDQVVEIFKRDYPLAYEMYSDQANVVKIDIDYGDYHEEHEGSKKDRANFPPRIRAKLKAIDQSRRWLL